MWLLRLTRDVGHEVKYLLIHQFPLSQLKLCTHRWAIVKNKSWNKTHRNCRKVQKKSTSSIQKQTTSHVKKYFSKQHVKIDQKLKAVKKVALNITSDMKTKLTKTVWKPFRQKITSYQLLIFDVFTILISLSSDWFSNSNYNFD